MKMNGTGGGSENSEHQKLPGYLQVTCGEIAGKQQEEDFAGGLPARNAPGFWMVACPDPCAWGAGRMMAVDNLWITMGIIQTPANAFNGRLARLTGVWLPYPIPCPENVATARETGLPGVFYGQKTHGKR